MLMVRIFEFNGSIDRCFVHNLGSSRPRSSDAKGAEIKAALAGVGGVG